MEDKFITLVIHSLSRAIALKTLLENHDIEVRLEDLDLPFQMQKQAVRVKISENKLPLALKITESGETYSPAQVELKLAGMSGNLLIPVDFSKSSMLSCKVGFELAERLSLHPVIIHTYVGAIFPVPGDDVMSVQEESDITEAEENMILEKSTEKMMADFKKKIALLQENGELTKIKFSTIVKEGVPEDVILEYTKETPPALVVMATRGKDRKEEELIGSVTAEVLDSCRVPVYTVPENYSFVGLDRIKRLVLFCNLDEQDLITVDSLMKMFGYPEVEVHLIPVNDRLGSRLEGKLEQLRDYLNSNYPTAKFTSSVLPQKNFRNSFGEYTENNGIQLIIVPNKKTNIFNRIFKPTIAHKCLFERDMPLLAIPV